MGYVIIALAKIPAGKRCNFSPTPPPSIQQLLKHCQRPKINKTVLSASPSSVFHRNFTISELKSKHVFHPNGN